jgi:phosphatidylserine/phosphatidylglycerophosphate/cardiolipin synthase-like enzyme
MPYLASHHQKFNIFRGPDNLWMATLGSGDFLFARYDTNDCNDVEPKRSKHGYASHDVWLKIEGPAVHDVALHFAERWNDGHNRKLTEPQISTPIPLDFRQEPLPSAGTHSLQILRTYALAPKRGYSWSQQGEFTIWAAYLNAIRKARRYIYLEDQYFYTFEDPPAIRGSGMKRTSDLVYQLGEAVKRGVDVLVAFPSRKGDWRKHYERQQRGWALNYLRDMSRSSLGAGRVLGAFLRKGSMDPIIHSKLMLVDDEYAIVGSANIGQRSMAHDSEVSLGMVDSAGQLVRDLRTNLWAKHMEMQDPDALLDVDGAIDAIFQSAKVEEGRLRIAPDRLAKGRFPYRLIMNRVIDPYAGPPRE